jgi:hypothetical protein
MKKGKKEEGYSLFQALFKIANNLWVGEDLGSP